MNHSIFADAGDRCGWPGALLFDLDGTLINSVGDLRIAINRTLADNGLGPLTVDAVAGMIGNGVPKLVARAFAAREVELAGAELTAAVTRMEAHYGEAFAVETVLREGADKILAAYHRARVKTAVVTNKRQGAAVRVLDHFGLSTHLDAVVGSDMVANHKPDPEMVTLALAKLERTPHRALMIGDSEVDVQTARAAGVPVVVVAGGYSKTAPAEMGADAVIDELTDLPRAIEALKAPA